jgi:beta-glucosidase
LDLINRVAPLRIPERKKEEKIDTPETAAMLRKIGADGIVLCKNEGDILPFSKDKTTAVIGPNAKFAAYSGGGSAKLAPYHTITPYEGLSSYCKKIEYGLGCIGYKTLPLLSEIARAPDGKSAGVEARVYLESAEATSRKPVSKFLINSTDCLFDGWEHSKIQGVLFWLEVEGIITAEVDGEYLFSLCVNGTAKLFVDGKEVVDNTENQRRGDSFFGLGTEEVIGTVPVKKGQQYRVLVKYGSSPTSKLNEPSSQHGAGGLRIGCTRKAEPEDLLDEAVVLAKSVDQVVLCVGLSDEWESEGHDRPNMALPPGTDELITAVCSANKNVVIVNHSGTPVAMPWINQAPAIIQAWFGGNETGNSIADIVFGEVNPSGKMPLTWPKRVEDNPAFFNYRSDNGKVLYGENVFVGYRFYEKTKRDVHFPFGHGLSYSTFTISNFDISDGKEDALTMSVTVHNSGSVVGAEVVQLYVAQSSPSVQRPLQELKGFRKVLLEPGKSQNIEITVSKKYATSYWDESADSFVMEKGTYQARLRTSSAGEQLRATFNVEKSIWWKGL